MIDRQKCCRSHNVNLKVIVGTYLLNGWSVSCTHKSYLENSWIPRFLGTWIPRFLDPWIPSYNLNLNCFRASLSQFHSEVKHEVTLPLLSFIVSTLQFQVTGSSRSRRSSCLSRYAMSEVFGVGEGSVVECKSSTLDQVRRFL